MELKTKRLWVRPFVLNDLNDMHEYCIQREVAKNAGWTTHKSIEESSNILNT